MATPNWKEWATLKLEIEPGKAFFFTGPYPPKEVWRLALLTLQNFGKAFPLGMKQMKRDAPDSVAFIPNEETGAITCHAPPGFHLWCGVPQVVVLAQQVAEARQLKELFRGHRAA